MIRYAIRPEVFELFPQYLRGVVVAEDVRNGQSPPELVAMLRDAEALVRARVPAEVVAEHPNLKPWREAFKVFGARPSDYRASVEALVRRVVKGQKLPSINQIVDIGNLVSLRHLVPAGAHALDEVKHDLCVRRATGSERFTAFQSDEVEHPEPGEIIFTEGEVVLVRRWVWRQAQHTVVMPDSCVVEFNIDGLPPMTTKDDILSICNEVVSLLSLFCGGRSRVEVLASDNAEIELP
ncbi:MAG: phenylalanine--tRNA ligase beta subunit-related protein [Dehalococcoidia bacterium]|nr:phenylalanine--tRNA ligase beta subunit-related protein [Dehalococcoidia bacterium]